MNPPLARLTFDGMREVMRRISALQNEGLPPDEFRSRGKAIFADQRRIDAEILRRYLDGG